MKTTIELVADAPPTAEGPTAPMVVRMRGPLDTDTAASFSRRLGRLLHEHPCLVADVADLTLTHTAAVHAFVAASEMAGGWPDARLVLAGPDPTLAALLAASGVARRIPVHRDVVTAARHVADRPELVRAWWNLPVTPWAPGQARGHIRRVCDQWAVDDEVREAAEIVVTELVTNAVEHAGSTSVVEAGRRPQLFRLRVRDFEPEALPAATVPAPTAPRGRGLAMVAAVSRSWGVDTHADGKTVWAEMGPVEG